MRATADDERVLRKVQRHHQLLGELAHVFYGIKAYQVGKGTPPQNEDTRDSKPFTAQSRVDGSFYPFYDGKHVGRYQLLWRGDNWLKYGPWLAEPRDPGKFEGDKILLRKIVSDTLVATCVSGKSFCNTLLYVVRLKQETERDHKYVLGVLNSHFLGWYFRKRFQIAPDDTFPQILLGNLHALPIPGATRDQHDRMVALVERMLQLHRNKREPKMPEDGALLERQVTATDREIDQLVYELYGLTDGEIAVVETGALSAQVE